MSEITFRPATRTEKEAIVTPQVQDEFGRTRERANAFYDQLGFEASHVGFNRYLDPA